MNERNSRAAFQELQSERREVLEWLSYVQNVGNLLEPVRMNRPCPHLKHRDESFILRPLFRPELDALVVGGCRSRDWRRVRLLVPERYVDRIDLTVICLRQRISLTAFSGQVILGWPVLHNQPSPDQQPQSDEEPGSTSEWDLIPQGIHSNGVVSNCLVFLDSWVYQNRLVAESYVAPGAAILGCGKVRRTKDPSESVWNSRPSMSISIGPERNGGRPVRVTPHSTMIDVCRQMTMTHPQAPDVFELGPVETNDTISVMGAPNLFAPGSILRETTTVDSVCLYSDATIEGASSVEQVVMFPSASITDASQAKRVFLQWNVSIERSTVTDCMIMESAHVGPQSIVAESILGPDVGVAAGEVHASVIGPNMNAHHQSLVISLLAPFGRGNVAYGANVGSNHTGRSPDQESVAGEGAFWGLSNVVVYPVDLSHSPYTIVAAGTTLRPQRITMPFSLIVSSQSGSGTDIIPGWVLSRSPYTLARSAQKFQTRRKAKRHAWYTGWSLFRRDTLVRVWVARQTLLTAGADAQREWYQGMDVSGIGTCKLSEKSRVQAIQAYTDCLRLEALRGLLQRLERDANSSVSDLVGESSEDTFTVDTNSTKEPSWPVMPWEESEEDLWAFHRRVLHHEFDDFDLSDMMENLITLERNYATAVTKCKQRDDVRGQLIIPDYAESHDAADQDSAVKQVQDELESTINRVKAVLQKSS